ncbi:phosphoesterase [Clostridia bacterium]|nr:phosphoesterase [Clostridia bacterium]
MKILVLSDSHKSVDRCYAAMLREQPGVVIHLGDHIDDARALKRELPGTRFEMVAGNCDYGTPTDYEKVIELEGVRILVTHGHLYDVKNGLNKLIRRGADLRVNLALYGHTHNAWLEYTRGFWLMNPGQMERDCDSRPAGYGIVTIADGKAEAELRKLNF